jgi:hypothetical protein
VLAQVSLPEGPIAGAQERAEDLLRGLIEAAEPVSGWKLLRGSSAYSHATGWWGGEFIDPDEWERAVSSVDPEFDRTSERLRELNDSFVEALLGSETGAEKAVGEIRWELASRAADPAQQLALRIRTLEGALPTPRDMRGQIASDCPEAFARCMELFQVLRQVAGIGDCDTGRQT